MELKVGKKYRIYWNEGNLNNATIHVRAIVDGDQVVYKQWSRAKQSWRYFVRDISWFELLERDGVIHG